MVTRTTIKDGNWSDLSVWGGTKPVDGDNVQINHNIIYDDDMSSMQNGILNLAIASGKLLTIKPDALTYFKMSGNMNMALPGTGRINCGTLSNPIQRPPIGHNVRAVFHYTGRDPWILYEMLNKIHGNGYMYGWVPTTPNHTFLSEDVSLNGNTLICDDIIDVQEGEQIVVGCGTDSSKMAESNTGIYTVSSRTDNIITLSTGLQKARKEGDVIAIYSRPITLKSDVFLLSRLYGVQIAQGYLAINLLPMDYNSQHEHCTFTGNWGGIGYSTDGSLKHSTMVNMSLAWGAARSYLKNCVSINTNYGVFGSANSHYIDCVIQNTNTAISLDEKSLYENCIFKNIGALGYNSSKIIFKNCKISFMLDPVNFRTNSTYLNPLDSIESIDDNQIIGAYKNYQIGGTIAKTSDAKYNFNLISGVPVKMDYIIHIPKNRTVKFLIGLIKSIPDISVKLQLINPFEDPLNVPLRLYGDTNEPNNYVPISEVQAENTTNFQHLGIAYKSTEAKQLILRVYAMASSGTVSMDVKQVEQMLSNPRLLLK